MSPFETAVPIALRVRIFARRQSEPRELVGARAPHRVVVERIERRHQAAADRGRARDRQLLPDHDGAQAREAAFAAAQGRAPGFGQNRRQARIGEHQLRERGIEIGFGVEIAGHFVRCCQREAKAGHPVCPSGSFEHECKCRINRHPFSASRRARTAICISAMRCRPSSMPTARRRPAGGCCCGSRTSIASRCRPEYEAAILEDLAWLGLHMGSSRCGGNPSI